MRHEHESFLKSSGSEGKIEMQTHALGCDSCDPANQFPSKVKTHERKYTPNAGAQLLSVVFIFEMKKPHRHYTIV